MTNPDMVKIKNSGTASGSAAGPAREAELPQPNPPAPLTDPDFQRDPDYPKIDPLDSNQLKPMLDKK